jgi:hypothetical protein
MSDLIEREAAITACIDADMPDGFELADDCCHNAAETQREWCAAAIRSLPTATEPLKGREELIALINRTVRDPDAVFSGRDPAAAIADAILSRGIAKAEVDEEKLAEAFQREVIEQLPDLNESIAKACARVAAKMMGGAR